MLAGNGQIQRTVFRRAWRNRRRSAVAAPERISERPEVQPSPARDVITMAGKGFLLDQRLDAADEQLRGVGRGLRDLPRQTWQRGAGGDRKGDEEA